MTTELSIDDAWETDDSSGLLTSYEGTVAEAYFFTDPNYNNGQSLMIGWEIDKDSIEFVDPDAEFVLPDDELVERWGIGAGWATNDGGETMEHPTKRQITASSQYARIVDAIQGKIEGLGDNATCASGFDLDDMNFDGLIDVLKGRGRPTEAGIWAGLRFRFEEVHIDYGEDKEGRKMQTRRNFPVAFLGEGDGDGGSEKKAPAKKAAKKSAKKAAKKKAAKSEPEEAAEDAADDAADESTGLSSEMFDHMVAIAGECDDFDAFTDAALSDEQVVADEAALADLTDESTSTTWAKAVADYEAENG